MPLLSPEQRVAIAIGVPAVALLLFLWYRRRQRIEILDDEDDEDEEATSKVSTVFETKIEVKVPQNVVGSIIGRRGENIKQIEKESGAHIRLKDDEKESEEVKEDFDAKPPSQDDKVRTVVIKGEREKAKKAEMMIKKVIFDQPKVFTVDYYIPQKSCGRVIGRGGSTIRHLTRVSGAKIMIDRNEIRSDEFRKCIIQGTSDQITSAKGLIDEQVAEHELAMARKPLSRRKTPSQPVSEQQASITPEETSSAKYPNTTDYVEVFVSAVDNPGHFWVQLVRTGDAQKLDALIDTLTNDAATGSENDNLDSVEVGMICSAPFSHDDSRYRAKVTQINNDGTVELFYVDYGDSEAVPKNKLRRLKEEHLELPFQAIECYLANTRPKGDTWDESATEVFKDLTHYPDWKVIVVKVLKYCRNVPCLDVYNTTEAQDIWINDEMVKRGFAVEDTGYPPDTNKSEDKDVTEIKINASDNLSSEMDTKDVTSPQDQSSSLDEKDAAEGLDLHVSGPVSPENFSPIKNALVKRVSKDYIETTSKESNKATVGVIPEEKNKEEPRRVLEEPYVQMEIQPEVESAPEVDPILEVKLASEVESVPEVKSASEMKSAPDVESAPEVKSAPEVESASEMKSAPEVESASEMKSVPEVESASEMKSVPEVESAPEVKSAPEVESAPEVKSVPEVESSPGKIGMYESESISFRSSGTQMSGAESTKLESQPEVNDKGQPEVSTSSYYSPKKNASQILKPEVQEMIQMEVSQAFETEFTPSCHIVTQSSKRDVSEKMNVVDSGIGLDVKNEPKHVESTLNVNVSSEPSVIMVETKGRDDVDDDDDDDDEDDNLEIFTTTFQKQVKAKKTFVSSVTVTSSKQAAVTLVPNKKEYVTEVSSQSNRKSYAQAVRSSKELSQGDIESLQKSIAENQDKEGGLEKISGSHSNVITVQQIEIDAKPVDPSGNHVTYGTNDDGTFKSISTSQTGQTSSDNRAAAEGVTNGNKADRRSPDTVDSDSESYVSALDEPASDTDNTSNYETAAGPTSSSTTSLDYVTADNDTDTDTLRSPGEEGGTPVNSDSDEDDDDDEYYDTDDEDDSDAGDKTPKRKTSEGNDDEATPTSGQSMKMAAKYLSDLELGYRGDAEDTTESRDDLR